MYITLVETDLQSGLTAPELSAVKTAAVSVGQTGAAIIAEVFGQVTTEIRGRVAACSANVLGEAGTIPDECKAAAVDMSVYRICKRLPGKAVLTQERIDANNNALSFLRDVAGCKVAIVPPAVQAPADEQAGGVAVETISTTSKKHGRDKLSGL